ncbi:hypothetical protein BGZ46_002705 [Entomortierella lignicola]|nr:hypothetical protein BGZ46_002705 [Entomortierella lignicola]
MVQASQAQIRIGVLALQGAFAEHIILLNTLPQVSEAVPIRNVNELATVDALVIPGGESTTMALIAERSGFWPYLQEYVKTHPTWGTCAGMILLSEKVTSGGTTNFEQKLLGGLGISIKRNAFGTQKESFEAGLHVEGLENAENLFPGVFIRAPVLDEILLPDEVQVVAKLERDYGKTPKGTIVAVKRGHLFGTAFHPELTRDSRIHQYFVKMAQESISTLQDVATGRLYALKKIRCPFGSEGVQDAMKEAEMYRTFQHENVIKVVDTCVVSDKDGSKIVYIFLPYYKRGNLLDAINANLLHHTHFSESDMLRFFRGICYGVRSFHCHRLPNVPISSRENDNASTRGIETWDSRDGRSSGRRQNSTMSASENGTGLSDLSRSYSNGVNGLGPAEDNEDVVVPFAHRDIKPANVLIADDGQTPVLMDFGSMARARVKIQTRQQALYEQDIAAEKCSMPYRAPELFDVKTGSTLDEKVDIWSLGCTLYAMAYGTSPFETNQINQGGSIALAVLNGNVRFPTVDQSDRYSSDFRDLIKAMLVVDPAMRLDIHQVIEQVDLLLARPA